jgi:hypothetical protein
MKSEQSLKEVTCPKHINAWNDSGLTQQAYCRTHQLNPSHFRYWKHKLKKLSSTAAKHVKVGPSESSFLAVEIAPSSACAPESDGLTVVLPGGIKLTGITSNNVSVVRHLMEGYL